MSIHFMMRISQANIHRVAILLVLGGGAVLAACQSSGLSSVPVSGVCSLRAEDAGRCGGPYGTLFKSLLAPDQT
jgi:hypothetical protein